MKKFRRILALTLLLTMCLITLVIAEEKTEVLIDSARNAAIKFKGQDSADGVAGNFSIGGDVVKGLVAGNADFKLGPDQAKEVGDASGALYYSMTDVMELAGNLDVLLPPDAKELTKLEANITSALTSAKSNVEGKFAVEGKGKDEVPSVKLDGSAKADSQKFDGRMGFDVDAAKMGPMAVKGFELTISEKAGSTTLAIGATVEPGTPYAQQMKAMVGQNPDMIKQAITGQLARASITVESVTVGEFKEDKDGASTKLTIVMKGWREALKPFVSMAAGGKFDAEKINTAVGQMLEAEFENIVFKYDLKDKALKGELSAKVNNAGKFTLGYYGLMSLVYEAQLKDQGDSQNPGQRFMLAYQVVAMEEAKKAMQAAIDANMGVDMKGNVAITPAGEDKKSVSANGSFNADISNFKGYIEKAKAAGVPAAENSAFKLVLNLEGGNRIKGTVYGYADTNVVNYYKTLVIATGKKAGAPAEALAEAEKVQFKASAGSGTLSKDGFKGGFYLESSDLSAITKLAMQAGMGQQQIGNLIGFSINGKTEGDKMNVDGSVNFSKFMEGKSADEVKAAIGSNATVKEGAKADEVALVAVSKPEVAMPAGLQAVADDGKKLLASNPIAALTGASGGKGGNGLLYALAGLAAVGVIGVGMAAGRKKS